MKNPFFGMGRTDSSDEGGASPSFTMSSRDWSLGRIVAVVILVMLAALALIHFDDIWKKLDFVWSVATPLAAGAILAYLLNIIMSQLERFYFPRSNSPLVLKTRRIVCLILALCIVAVVLTVVIWLVAGQMKDSISALIDGISAAISALAGFASNLRLDSVIQAVFGRDITEWDKIVADIVNEAGGVESMVSQVVGFSGALTGGVVDAVITLVFALYLLASKERAIAGARTFANTVLPEKWFWRVSHAMRVANDCFSRFISGQCLEAMILGSLCALGMTLFNFPHALTIGVCVGLFSLVPLVGAWIGGAVGVLMILPYSFEQAIFFVVFLLILQQLEGHFIYPRVVGNAVGVSSIWVLVAVFVGGAMFGVPGILLGVPCVATASTLLEGFWKHPPSADGCDPASASLTAPADVAPAEVPAVVGDDVVSAADAVAVREGSAAVQEGSAAVREGSAAAQEGAAPASSATPSEERSG